MSNSQRANKRPHSRGIRRPSFGSFSPLTKTKGAGKAGCTLHPRSRVQFAHQKRAHEHTGQRRHPGFPCAMGYGLLRALPGERLFCLRRSTMRSIRQDRCAPVKLSASTATPEPHDFTVRVRRLTSTSALRVHRISPRVRDVANAPLVDEMRVVMALIWPAREAEYFSRRGSTSFTDLPVVPIGRMPRAALCACAAGKSAGSSGGK